MSQANATKVDGRVERTAATRRNILTVTRELILEGVLAPTAREIADKAGITTRTLFRHFPDMASLHRDFIEEANAGAASVMDEPFPEGRRKTGERCSRWLSIDVLGSMSPCFRSTYRRYGAGRDKGSAGAGSG